VKNFEVVFDVSEECNVRRKEEIIKKINTSVERKRLR